MFYYLINRLQLWIIKWELRYIRLKIWLIWLIRQSYCGWYFLYMMTPWYKAYIRATVNCYMATTMWRDRVINFGPDFAMEQFKESKKEIHLFQSIVRKDKKLMLKIIFSPYSV